MFLFDGIMEAFYAAAKGFCVRVVATKRLWFTPHEDYGRANILRAVCLTYVAGFVGYKMYSSRRAKSLKVEQGQETENIVRDALSRCGLL
uniref:Integral membrane protein n=1 Tax=Syphacia muris TaxID=451379 RepID=A0A0N5B0T0_9BILA